MDIIKKPLITDKHSNGHPITGGRGLTIDECLALCKVPRKLQVNATKFQLWKHLRDEILIRLLYETWARINELLNVKIEDIDIIECAINIKHPKGKSIFKFIDGKRTHVDTVYRPRWVYFGEVTRDILIRFLEGRNKGPLIINHKGKKLSSREAERIVNQYAQVCGIQKVIGHTKDNRVVRLVTCRSLRESGERHADICGADRDATARIAGHTVRTKEAHYKLGNFEEDRAIIQANHPLMSSKINEKNQFKGED
jgi:integrase